MNSTPTAIEPRDALVARADEQFAHVHEQNARAGGLRRLAAGGVHRCRRPGFVFVLWQRGQAACGPLGAAARFIYRSSGRCGGSTTASNAPGSDRTARRHADSYPSSSRFDTVAAKDGARSRESGAKHRTAQGEPATNGRRQFKSHWGAQGQPGRDKARAREGFRAEPAQDVTASDAADSDLAQARADASVPVRESAASNPKGMVLRRMVAVDAVIIEVLSWQQRLGLRYFLCQPRHGLGEGLQLP